MSRLPAFLRLTALLGLLGAGLAGYGRATAAGPGMATNPLARLQATGTPGVAPGTRYQPAEIGQTVRVRAGNARFEVTIVEVITGQEALACLREAGQPGVQPPGGQEYLLFYATVAIRRTGGEESISLGQLDWRMVDTAGRILRPPAVAPPRPQLSGSGRAGDTVEGWAVVTRPVTEPVAVVFGLQPDGSGGAWFAVP